MTVTRLCIRLLGTMCVVLPDGRLLDELGPQSGALLARLALDPQRTFTREELIDFLWPEGELEEGRRKLRQLVYGIRRQLEQAGYSGVDPFCSGRDTLQIDPAAVSVDAKGFECLACRAGHSVSPAARVRLYTQALDAYQGELLPGFYQDEFLADRRRFADICFGVLRSLAQAQEALGHPEEAVAAARRAVDLNPTGEEAHRDLMRLYALTGKPSAVLRQYEELERALRDELDVEPSPASRELLDALRHADTVPPPAQLPRPTDSPLAPPHTTSRPGRERQRRATLLAATPFVVVSAFVILCVLIAARPRTLASRPQAPAVSLQNEPLWVFRYPRPPGYGDAEPSAITIDPAGDIYTAGLVRTPRQDTNFLILKLDPDGRMLWQREYNGPGNDVDRAHCIALDRWGHIYVTGDSDL